MSYTYPSALLPAVSTPGHTAASQPTWKPDHLLTRHDRRRLSDEARDINVYDLGWRRNIVQTLLGDNHNRRRRRGVIGLFSAIWPLSPARNGNGHDFEYDEEQLGRLRRLTEELRLGVRREVDEDVEEEESDDDD
jgi:hypothetical protein